MGRPSARRAAECPRTSRAGPRSRCGGVIVLALCVAAASLVLQPPATWLVFSAAPALARQRIFGPSAAQRRLWRLALQAEGEEAAASEESAPEGTGTEAAQEPAASEAAEEEAKPQWLTKPLFQALNVSTNSTPKSLMKAMVAVYSKGERAVDLVLIDPRQKHKLIYSIAVVPKPFQASAQIQFRKRDRRLRVRVRQHHRPQEAEEPEVMFVARSTNISKLGTTIKDRLVDPVGNNRMHSVKLRFNGNDAATNSILAIEDAMFKMHRELTFTAEFVPLANQTASTGGDASAGESGDATAQAAPAAPVRRDVLLSVIAS